MEIKENFTKKSKIKDIGRFYVTNFVQRVAESLPPGSWLLDAGAGEGAYKKFFNHCNYKAVDLAIGDSNWHYEHLDFIAPLDNLPIKEDFFDAVLCTQVLEHLKKPAESIREMYRVLKPGGYLFLTAPMSHNEHQVPYDFFRYTSYGLKYLCEVAGFTEIEVAPFGGLFVRWAYELPRMMALLPGTGLWRGKWRIRSLLLLPIKLFCFGIIRFLQIIFLRLDRFDTIRDDPFGWQVIARK